jgi:uncharacterized ParB-like nuclease family protein
MPASSESLVGPRLEFVARKLPGTVTRIKYKAPPTAKQREKDETLSSLGENEQIEVTEDAGFMIYFPTGKCYRLSAAELVTRKFDREPEIISIDQANDTKSPAGRFKLARNDQIRQKAWKEMEQQVINACLRGVGDPGAFISGYNPRGKVMEEAA